jgi:hypothetical protein
MNRVSLDWKYSASGPDRSTSSFTGGVDVCGGFVVLNHCSTHEPSNQESHVRSRALFPLFSPGREKERTSFEQEETKLTENVSDGGKPRALFDCG